MRHYKFTLGHCRTVTATSTLKFIRGASPGARRRNFVYNAGNAGNRPKGLLSLPHVFQCPLFLLYGLNGCRTFSLVWRILLPTESFSKPFKLRVPCNGLEVDPTIISVCCGFRWFSIILYQAVVVLFSPLFSWHVGFYVRKK